MVEPRLFIFAGLSEEKKQDHLRDLEKKSFAPEIKQFNYALFYGDEKDFTPKALKETLSAFPTAGATRRVCVIKNAQKFIKANLEILKEEMNRPDSSTVVVCEFTDAPKGHDFEKSFPHQRVKLISGKVQKPLDVFDLGRAMLAGRSAEALKILTGLVTDREKNEKILGAIFWQWEKFHSERKLSDEAYKKGLKFILDTDKRLKSSSSAVARDVLLLESLVIKLSYLARS